MSPFEFFATRQPPEGDIRLDAYFIKEKNGVFFVKIEVTDTGIGINPEQQSRLFSSFVQAESSTSRKFGGTGLGLAISKRIVEMMGGSIWIESELGKGSTFAFVIPAKRGDSEAAAENLSAEDEPSDKAENFEGYHLLLAEDVEINREIVLALLEPTHLAIDCAENGAEALRMFSSDPDHYDMIFMDVQMPEMDGYEATRRIRALNVSRAQTIPIIAMTANVFREDIENCLAAGMNDHVGKPLDFNDVLGKLRKYIKKLI
ncbi:hypothetical protein FACS1894204_02500 [Synergistales bacterium]|nr:hypothetical protein FACS1894204_02500 [Synergistales bacterium]